VSSTSRGGVRSADDFYETMSCDSRPGFAAIAPKLPQRRLRIFEPMAGRGALIPVMREFWPDSLIHTNELDPERAQLLRQKETDLVLVGDLFRQTLRYELPFDRYDVAITNPAFVFAVEAVELLSTFCDHVVILQRINFLGSIERRAFWDKYPADLHILSKRPSFAASLKCGRKRGKVKDPCGWKHIQFLDAPRPKNCPKCQAGVDVSTSDSIEYAWCHFYAGSLRQYGHIGRIEQAEQGSLLEGVA
jgi:hypothetical protein